MSNATTPKVPFTLDEADFLRMKNISLSAQVIMLKLDTLQRQVGELLKQRDELSKEAEGHKKLLSEKYGVDFGSVHVSEQGVVSHSMSPR